MKFISLPSYPASSVKNNFWDRINENSQYQQQQPYMGDQQQYGLQNSGQQLGQLNNYLLMLLLLRQQQQQMMGGGGSWGCYDQADNCGNMKTWPTINNIKKFSFSPLLFSLLLFYKYVKLLSCFMWDMSSIQSTIC